MPCSGSFSSGKLPIKNTKAKNLLAGHKLVFMPFKFSVVHDMESHILIKIAQSFVTKARVKMRFCQ